MGKSKYAHLARQQSKKVPRPNNPSDVGKRNAELERSREKLMSAIIEYKDVLQETELMRNKTQLEKQKIGSLLETINTLATELNGRNLGEGSLVLGTAALNALLLQHNQINELRFQNYYINERLKALEAPAETKEVEKAVESEEE